jgi:hypothetical protein
MSVRWTGVVTFAAVIMAAPASAQWLKYPTPGMPRTPDGKPNLSAPAPRTADGKPKLAGLWITQGIYIGDITKDLKPGEVPFQPWAEALYKQRRATESKDDPTGRCIPGGVPRSTAVPYPFKIVQGEDLVVILYEAVHSFRQIFTDGRPLPRDAQPTWMGYSIGKWEGDTFVVETIGQNGKTWLDMRGLPATEALRVIERFTRPTIGHIDIDVTIDDPKAYTKPWKVTLKQQIAIDTELVDEICLENEKSFQNMR